MHQVSFTKPDATVNEQRVVSTARVLCNLHGRRAAQLVGLAFNEAVEGKLGA